MLEPDHKHYGKAMLILDEANEVAEMTMECVTCGRFVIRVPLIHLRSSLHMLEGLADSLGLPEETTIAEVQSVTGTVTREEVENISQQFDHMEVEPPWLQKHVSPPSDGNWD